MQCLAARMQCLSSMHLTYLFFLLILSFLFAPQAAGQDWSALKPIESNCVDVDRVMNTKDACEGGTRTYETKLAILIFSFAGGVCDCSAPSKRYDVAKGVVTGVSVLYRYPAHITFADLSLDMKEFSRESDGDLLNSFVFRNLGKGITITGSASGDISSIHYAPPSGYDHLLCRSSKESNGVVPPLRGDQGHL